MITKLRNNFMLANVLSKVLLVCTYVFANWKSFAGALTFVTGSASWATVLLGSTVSGAVIVVLAHFLPRLFLRFTKIYTVPYSEFSLFATLAWALYCLLVGLLNLILLAAPTFATWASVLFPTVSVIASGLAFYAVTSKLYFNDVTRPYYFYTLSVAVLALAVFAGGVL